MIQDDSHFPSTVWQTIQAAQDPGHPEHGERMGQVLARYWKPVFVFLRARGCSVAEAEDLAQEFFAAVLACDWPGWADPERGRHG